MERRVMRRALPPILWLLAIAFLASPVYASTGTVKVESFPSPSIGGVRNVHVYLPPNYTKDAPRRYPLIVALHGLGGSDKDFFKAGQLGKQLDQAIAEGTIQPVIVVAPDGGNGYWTNHFRRRRRAFGKFVVRDILQEADRRYRTLATRQSRAIVGLSMGGHGALSIALRHPKLFGAAISLSGALFLEAPTHRKLYKRIWGNPPNERHWKRTSPIELMRKLNPKKGPIPRLYIHCGDRDPLKFYPYARKAARILKYRRIPYTFSRTRGGRHSWRVWREEGPRWIKFLAKEWKASP